MKKGYVGSIVKRGNGFSWRHKKLDGKWTLKALKATSFTEAEFEVARLDQDRQELESLKNKADYLAQVAEVKGLIQSCKVTVSELESAFFTNCNRNEITSKCESNYRYTLRNFVAYLLQQGIETIADINEDIASEYLRAYWRSGISASTYNDTLNRLRIILGLFRKADNPFGGGTTKTKTPEERSAFSLAQLENIWKTLTSEGYYMLNKSEMITLYILALNTGLRCGDCCLLQWKDIDLAKRVIALTPSKTRKFSHKRVVIPINDSLFLHLSSLPQSFNYVLPNVADRYTRNPGGIYKDTTKLLEATGVQTKEEGTSRRVKRVVKYSFHSFRHTFASLLIENGANQVAVSKFLGHSTLTMTNRYIHISDSTKLGVVNTLSAISSSITQAEPCNDWKAILDFFQNANSSQTLKLAKYLDMALTDNQKRAIMMIA